MRFIVSSLLFLFSLFGYAADTSIMIVDPNSSQFTVTLPANPTTGYKWTATTYDHKLLNLVSSRFNAPQTKLIGAGGKTTFTFKLMKGKTYPKATKILFTYAQPWEPKSGTIKKVTITFKH